MKIQKFNESNNYEQEELDNFIELFQNKFFKDKYIKSYSCSQSSRKKYINLVLNFANITKQEIPILQEIMEYIKTYDNDYVLWLEPNQSVDIACNIGISLKAFDNIYDQLKLEKTGESYNL